MTGHPADRMPADEVPLRTPEQARRAAERRNRKLAAREPLLALIGEARQVTAEQLMSEEIAWRAKLAAFSVRQTARADLLRSQVAEGVTAERMQELDAYRARVFPPGGDYGCEFWFKTLREVWPARAWELCGNRERHADFARWHERCPTCGLTLVKEATSG